MKDNMNLMDPKANQHQIRIFFSEKIPHNEK